MASIKLKGDTSGEVTIQAPSVAGTTTLNLPATSSTLATQNSLGVRNLIINGDMRIAQKGASAVTTNLSFPVDRWTMYNSGGTFTAQQQTFTLGDAPDSRLQNYVRLTRSSPSGILYFTQKIEDVINSNNVTVTVSFYAKANTDITVPVRLVQVFGSGGSTAVTVGSINNSVTSSWQRFTATFTCPSLSGKTIGTSSYLELTFDTPATYSTLDITGVQLEVGETATPFEHRPYDMELQRCMRYYWKPEASNKVFGTGYVVSATRADMYSSLPVTMRTVPSIVNTSVAIRINYAAVSVLATTITLLASSTTGFSAYITGASGLTVGQGVTVANNGVLELNAEL